MRVFLIDGLRDRNTSSPNGIHEVKLKHGRIVRDGLDTTLTDLRLRKTSRSPRDPVGHALYGSFAFSSSEGIERSWAISGDRRIRFHRVARARGFR